MFSFIKHTQNRGGLTQIKTNQTKPNKVKGIESKSKGKIEKAAREYYTSIETTVHETTNVTTIYTINYRINAI